LAAVRTPSLLHRATGLAFTQPKFCYGIAGQFSLLCYLESFLVDVLKHSVFQAQVRKHLLQPVVRLLSLLHPFHFTDAHPTLLGFPLVKCGFANSILAAQNFHRYANVRFVQDVYDLAFRKLRLLPGKLS
jgi:hypothetical protein